MAEYYREHGTSDVSLNVDKGSEEYSGIKMLHKWCHTQRALFKQRVLSLDQVQQLQALNFKFYTQTMINVPKESHAKRSRAYAKKQRGSLAKKPRGSSDLTTATATAPLPPDSTTVTTAPLPPLTTATTAPLPPLATMTATAPLPPLTTAAMSNSTQASDSSFSGNVMESYLNKDFLDPNQALDDPMEFIPESLDNVGFDPFLPLPGELFDSSLNPDPSSASERLSEHSSDQSPDTSLETPQSNLDAEIEELKKEIALLKTELEKLSNGREIDVDIQDLLDRSFDLKGEDLFELRRHLYSNIVDFMKKRSDLEDHAPTPGEKIPFDEKRKMRGGYLYHIMGEYELERHDHDVLMHKDASYAKDFNNGNANYRELMLNTFNGEPVIHSERRLYKMNGLLETLASIPHLRDIRRPKVNTHMYLCTDLVTGLLDHVFAYLKKDHYHWTVSNVKYVLFFKNDTAQMTYFSQCNYPHAEFGRSTVGAKPDGILKITLNAASPFFEIASWDWIEEIV